VGFAEEVKHALCGQVALHLFPHGVAQFFLGDVQPDAQRHWEVHQVQPVGDDEHAVDGDLDAYHVIEMCWRTGHICPVCVRVRKIPVIVLWIMPEWFATSANLSHKSSEDAAAEWAVLTRTSSPDMHLLVLGLHPAAASRPAARGGLSASNLAATGIQRGPRCPR
jgi:hypothetical protein